MRAVAATEAGECVASLSYVYNDHQRALMTKLLDIGHAHHALIYSTTHVHLDHDGCLERMMLRGPASEVRAFAERVRAERGVRFGALNPISAGAARGKPEYPPHTHPAHGHSADAGQAA